MAPCCPLLVAILAAPFLHGPFCSPDIKVQRIDGERTPVRRDSEDEGAERECESTPLMTSDSFPLVSSSLGMAISINTSHSPPRKPELRWQWSELSEGQVQAWDCTAKHCLWLHNTYIAIILRPFLFSENSHCTYHKTQIILRRHPHCLQHQLKVIPNGARSHLSVPLAFTSSKHMGSLGFYIMPLPTTLPLNCHLSFSDDSVVS